MFAKQLYTISDSDGKSIQEPVRALCLDRVSPALRCLYCERCGLFLGTFAADAGSAPFACAFAPARHCLCTLPTETLCRLLLGNRVGEEPLRPAQERLRAAFQSVGCNQEEAAICVAAFFPLSRPVRAWLLRHLQSRPICPTPGATNTRPTGQLYLRRDNETAILRPALCGLHTGRTGQDHNSA